MQTQRGGALETVKFALEELHIPISARSRMCVHVCVCKALSINHVYMSQRRINCLCRYKTAIHEASACGHHSVVRS